MKCNKCQTCIYDYYNIVNDVYCLACIDKYMLTKCPTSLCFNVVSLNDELNNLCAICNAIICDFCTVTYHNLLICRNCHNINS